MHGEVDLAWRRIDVATAGGPAVELARTSDGVVVRRSDDPDGTRLSFTPAEITAFLDGIKAGEFDDLAAGPE